jgi:predicted amidophosphoribosyltransferase
MSTPAKDKILEIARARAGVRPHELARDLGVSLVTVHKQLKRLVEEGLLEKRGKPPQVIYLPATTPSRSIPHSLPQKYTQEIEDHFSYFTPTGEELCGTQGFITFLQRTNQAQDIEARAEEYTKILSTAESFRDSTGLIDGTKKLQDTFAECFLARLYYSDFYSLPKYGKTQLGQFLLHGKSGQNVKLIAAIAERTKRDVQTILDRHKIEAIAFAPHSIPRKTPFLKEYRRLLGLQLPEIRLIKAFQGDVPIAQKSLSKLSERIENARQTNFVADTTIPYKRILIIDDALGSGATINEIAAKLKRDSREIYGYAIVGSYKGFEVIQEV